MATPYDTIKNAVLGVPFDPNKKPSRAGTVRAFDEMQKQLEGSQAGAIIRDTLATLNALTSVSAPSVMAWVVNDPVEANNGIYENTGTEIAPAWTRRTDLPRSAAFTAMNDGDGSANAIQADTNLPIPAIDGSYFIFLNITENNTGPTTVSFNNGTALPIKTISNADLTSDNLKAGMLVAGTIVNGNFQLFSDLSAESILIQTEAARDTAIAAQVIATASRTDAIAARDAALAAKTSLDALAGTITIEGVVTNVEDYGAVSDLTFNWVSEGAERTAGTNNHAAFRAADRFAFANNLTIRANGQYYLKSFHDQTGDGTNTSYTVEFDTAIAADVKGVLIEIATGNLTIIDQSEFSISGQVITYPLVGSPIANTHKAVFYCSWIPQASWIVDTPYTNYLWCEFSVLESGLWFKNSNINFEGFRVFGQYNRCGGNKPSNAGHIGNIWTIGDFLLETQQTKITGCNIDIQMCRAANVNSQVSNPSQMSNEIGYVEKNTFTRGLFGYSNVSSGAVRQAHWGGQIEPGFTFGEDNLADANVIEIYHPALNNIKWSTDIDTKTNNHRLEVVNITSATGGNKIESFVARGVPIIHKILQGDESNATTISEQKDVVFKQDEYEFYQGLDCPHGLDPLVSVIGRGTDKQDDYSGTSVKLVRQEPIYPKFKGAVLRSDETAPNWITATSYSVDDVVTEDNRQYICINSHTSGVFATDLTNEEWVEYLRAGVRIYGGVGEIELGDLWVSGCRKGAIENEVGNAKVICKIHESDRTLRHEFVKGGEYLATKIDLGNVANPEANSPSARGYNTNNTAIYVFGNKTKTATTTADVIDGATETEISPVDFDYSVDDEIEISGSRAYVTETLYRGGLIIKHTPINLSSTVLTGATVTLDRKCRIDKLIGNYSGSELGLEINYGNVFDADLSNVKWAGRHAAWVRDNSLLYLRGEMPLGVGRITGGYTIQVEPNCHVVCNGMEIRHNQNVLKHFHLKRASSTGPFGTATFIGCRIENVDELCEGNSLLDQAKLIGCVDFDGNALPEHIGGMGTWTPEVRINSSTAGITETVNNAYFTVSGVWVDLSFDITLTNKGASTGDVSIGNVPVGSLSNVIFQGDIRADNLTLPANQQPGLQMLNGSLRLQTQSNTNNSAMQESDITNTTQFIGNIRYRRK